MLEKQQSMFLRGDVICEAKLCSQELQQVLKVSLWHYITGRKPTLPGTTTSLPLEIPPLPTSHCKARAVEHPHPPAPPHDHPCPIPCSPQPHPLLTPSPSPAHPSPTPYSIHCSPPAPSPGTKQGSATAGSWWGGKMWRSAAGINGWRSPSTCWCYGQNSGVRS